MTADVSFLVRVMTMNGFRDDRRVVSEPTGGNSTALVTRDLLGGGGGGGSGTKNDQESQELDLDMEVPSGWEKRLDLKSGKVYLQRCNSSSTSHSSSSDLRNRTVTKLEDLNFPPSPSKVTLNLFDEGKLLKLVPSDSLVTPLPSSSSNYQSVCTLEKVKSALERAEKEPIKKRPALWSSSLSSSYSSSSSSTREIQEENNEDKSVLSRIAAGCPSCLSYVLVMKSNPKCPRCNSVVPPMPLSKKPRIDLNISI